MTWWHLALGIGLVVPTMMSLIGRKKDMDLYDLQKAIGGEFKHVRDGILALPRVSTKQRNILLSVFDAASSAVHRHMTEYATTRAQQYVDQRRADDERAVQRYRDGVNAGIDVAATLLRAHGVSIAAHMRAQHASEMELSAVRTFVEGAATLIEAEKQEPKP